ncbi:MAG: DNA primase [Chloroflexi bacterium]|nr:DNA primase [Chloroflexota bacterium]
MGILEDVKSRIEITELVAQYVQINQSGQNYKGLCPFHDERTPSFFIFPQTNAWRCFGACSDGGDGISFIMKAENLNFKEALSFIANQLGISINLTQPNRRLTPLQEANEAAASYYQNYLNESLEGKEALEYLLDRGLHPNTISNFNLGLSPNERQKLKSYLIAKGFKEQDLLDAGLIKKSQNGFTYDTFSGRIMFPIQDINNLTIGFGARTMNDEIQPKYINSPKTILFDKGSTIYAINKAFEPIKTKGQGIIVEGYMDVITAHQYGFNNVVASMGTSLTTNQVTQLSSIGSEYVLALDSDAAGKEATVRSLENAWKTFEVPSSKIIGNLAGTLKKTSVRIATLPNGTDPDNLIQKHPDLWNEIISESKSITDFFLDVLPDRYDLSTNDGKLQIAERFGVLLLNVDDSGTQDYILEKLEAMLDVKRHTLHEILGLSRHALIQKARGTKGNTQKIEGYASGFSSKTSDPIEDYILSLLLQNPDLTIELSEENELLFQNSENRTIFLAIFSGSIMDIDSIVEERVEKLKSNSLPPMDIQQKIDALNQCLQRLEKHKIQNLTMLESTILDKDKGDLEESKMLDVMRQRHSRLKELFSSASNEKGLN